MTLKGLIKLLLVAAVLFTGVQFAKVYVHKTQLKKVMSDEALDARRDGRMTAGTLKAQVKDRMRYENVNVPEFQEFEITGMGDPKADIVLTARYQEVVDLLVYKHVMNVTVVGRADSPNK